MSVTLRPYQDDALTAIENAEAAGIRRPLVALPTGTGKTVVFSSLIQRRGDTALILAHRDELLRQAEHKLLTVAPELGMSIGFVQAHRNDVGAPIIVASVATLARPERLKQLPRHVKTLVIDEAHHATAPSYRAVLEHVDADIVVGFTATPERSDKAQLSDVWEQIVYARSLLDMIREGYLCDLRGIKVELDDLDLSTVKVTRGDYQADDLGRAMTEAHAPEQTAAAILQHAADRKTIVFCPTVDLAQATAAAMNAAGIKTGHVNGETDPDERRAILADFGAGRLQAITNVDVLTEGYDEPSVSCVAIAAPTKSRIAYVQKVGRGTRLHPSKDDCLVLDLAGVSDDLKLQSLPSLFNLRKPPPPGETMSRAVAREQAEDEDTADEQRRVGELTSKDADLFGARDRLSWLQVGERWVISAGRDTYLVLDPTGDTWRVLRSRESGAAILASGLDLGYAQGAAEEALRRWFPMRYADAKAGWRGRPATEYQRRSMRKLGIKTEAETAGEASDLITGVLVRRQLRKLDKALAARAAA